MFCRRVDLFMKYCLISSVLIMTMIGSFSSSTGSVVGLDVFKTILGHFKSLTRTMMSSGFCNTLGVYCFRFLVNFLYLSLASLCSDVVSKTAPKPSTSYLKFLIDGMYGGRLKRTSIPSCTWQLPLPIRPPRLCPRSPFLEFDSLFSEARVIVASLPSLPLPTAAGEAVSVSEVIVFYSFLLFFSEYC